MNTGFYAVTVDMLDKVLSLSDKELEKFRIDPREYLNKEQEQSTKESKQESTKEQVPEEKKEKVREIIREVFAEAGLELEETERGNYAMAFSIKGKLII